MTEDHDPTEVPEPTGDAADAAPPEPVDGTPGDTADAAPPEPVDGAPGPVPPPPPLSGTPERVLAPPPAFGRPGPVPPPPSAGQAGPGVRSPFGHRPPSVAPQAPGGRWTPSEPAPSPNLTGTVPAAGDTPADPGPAPSAAGPTPPGQDPVAPGAAEAVTPAAAKPATKRVSYRSTPRKAATRVAAQHARSSPATPVNAPARPATLAIDVGGTGLKASVLDASGKLVADRVRVATTYPCPPDGLVEKLAALVAPLPGFDRVSVGFPGVVRKGIVLTAPHFVTRSGPESPVVPKLLTAWTGFDLAGALANRLGHPVRVANDADLQGLDVVSGSGLEFVVTLGTGVGTALFLDGKLAPHLELAHHPFRKGEDYNDQLGEAALRKIGAKKWRKRVEEAFANFQSLVNYDRLYVGGGNARLLDGHVGPSVTIVDNLAGILGGIKLWEAPEHI